MSERTGFLRRIAAALITHAREVLPPDRAPWADAMERELQHIESDAEALRWAAGCVVAGCVERSRAMDFINSGFVRVVLMLLIAGQVLSMLFATVMTVAYRLHLLGIASFLGGFTPGDDYRRFIPLMDATPWWLHGLCVAASVLFAVSAWQLLRNCRQAFPLFAAAWVLGAIGNFVSDRMPIAYRQVFSFPGYSFRRDLLIPAAGALVPVVVAGALWIHSRHADQTPVCKGT